MADNWDMRLDCAGIVDAIVTMLAGTADTLED